MSLMGLESDPLLGPKKVEEIVREKRELPPEPVEPEAETKEQRRAQTSDRFDGEREGENKKNTYLFSRVRACVWVGGCAIAFFFF